GLAKPSAGPAVRDWVVRSDKLGKGTLNHTLKIQVESELKYWRSVLNRVVAVIKFLSSKGLAFRGENELFGSYHNGNFLGTLELLAKFDPFLAKHIETHGNKGRGQVSYLSSTICDEFILIMGNEVIKRIVDELKLSKYYSIIVDSTPDVSKIDQLTLIVRYILPNGMQARIRHVAKYAEFIPCSAHSLNLVGANAAQCNESGQ
ncbi:zinc finger MYM-type protein 1-like, partial [Aphis craccivora]